MELFLMSNEVSQDHLPAGCYLKKQAKTGTHQVVVPFQRAKFNGNSFTAASELASADAFQPIYLIL